VLERMSDADFRKWTSWTVLTIGVFYLGSAAWMFWRG
jgi:cbb3-type cytochrome oxidase subunit 3